jgi:ABC-type uncharacterized transport system substrate-binding protein
VKPNSLYAVFPLALLVFAAPAAAHPDVAASVRLVFHLDGNRLTGLTQILGFDQATSRRLAVRFDADQDGTLSDAERAALTSELADRLSSRGFFLEARRGLEAVNLPPAASVRVVLATGQVTIAADYRWPSALQLDGQPLSLMLRDRDFTIAFRFDPVLPAVLSGSPGDCEVSVAPEPNEAYFGGLVIPEILRLTCR